MTSRTTGWLGLGVSERAPATIPAMRRARVILFSTIVSLGCSSTTGAENPRSHPSASGAAPLASASATPQPHDPATDPEPIAAIGPFTLALSSVSVPRFFQLEDALVAVDNRFYRPSVHRLGEGGFVEMPGFFEGLRVRKGTEDLLDFQVESLGGSTGGDVVATISMPGERGGTVASAKRHGGRWSADPEKTVYELSGSSAGFWYFGPRAIWGAHAIAAPTADEPTFRAFEYATGFLEGARAGVVPVSTTAGAPAGCARRMQTYAALFNGAGDRLIALGSACGSGAAAVEWWTDGQADGAFMELPGEGALDASSLSVETIDAEPWIFGVRTGRLFAVRFDGATWKDATPGPAAGPIEVRLIGKPGALAVFGRDAAYRRTDRAWTAIPVPRAGHESEDFFEDGPDAELWASFQGRLYRMTPTGARFERVVLPEVKGATFRVTGLTFDAAREPIVLARSSDGAILTFLLTTRRRGQR